MKKERIEVKYYETYYFANIVNNILKNRFDYLRLLNEFYGDDNYNNFLEPFQKYSVFHQFIDFIIHSFYYEEIGKVNLNEQRINKKRYFFIPEEANTDYDLLFIEEAFLYHSIDYTPFKEWLIENNKIFENAVEDDVFEYYQELCLTGEMHELVRQICEEVFFIMFINRNLLTLFNDMIASIISEVKIKKIETIEKKYFKNDGVLKRATIPEWVKRTIYYRDRGRCVLCNIDLSGIVTLQNYEEFDHIVPLSQGGINDISNMQLLCESCNRKKSGDKIITSNKYEKWY